MSNEKSKLTVQEKMTKLSELVSWFQEPDFKLEDALAKFKEAEALADEIEKDLTGLKKDITVLKQKFDESRN